MNISKEFILIVAGLAIIYALITRFIQFRVGNQKKMKELQKQMNAVNKEYMEAMKSRNEKRMEEISKQQQELMKEFNPLLMGQFKTMAVIIGVFLIFMWGVGALDPNISDDVTVEFADMGSGTWCGDFTASGSPGPWMMTVKSFSGGGEKGQNGTIFYLGERAGLRPYTTPKGEAFPVWPDKEVYQEGETATVCASVPAGIDRVVGTANSGTWFMVELPFTIPIFNVTVIHEPYWWFILISIIASLLISLIYGRVLKKG